MGRSVGRHVLLGSRTSSRTSTSDSRLACAEDAESDTTRARLGVGGPRERHAPLDVAQLRGPPSLGSHSRGGAVRLVRHRAAARTTIGSHPAGAGKRPRNLRGAPAASAATRSRPLSAPSRRFCRRNKLPLSLSAALTRVAASVPPNVVYSTAAGACQKLHWPVHKAECKSEAIKGAALSVARPPRAEADRVATLCKPRKDGHSLASSLGGPRSAARRARGVLQRERARGPSLVDREMGIV